MAWCPRASPSVPHNDGGSLQATPISFLPVSALCDGSPMTVRGGGVPAGSMALMPTDRMGPPPRSFAADAHHCIMVRVVRHPPNTSMWRDPRAHQAGSPRYSVIPTIPSVPSCSEPSRYGLAMMGARCNVGATANLDSPCARQRLGLVGRGKETGSRSNKETDEEKR